MAAGAPALPRVTLCMALRPLCDLVHKQDGCSVMKLRIPNVPLKFVAWGIGIIVLAFAVIFNSRWVPALTSFADRTLNGDEETSGEDDDEDSHAGHDHGDHPHDEATSLELSVQARRNIGLTKDKLEAVHLQTFRRSINIPAMVVERPGRTRIQVATPMTGVVTHVHAVTGESVESGTLLFQIRLTHEDLVEAQTGFLKTLGELEVEEQEIKRLEPATRSGAVAPVKLLERQYAAKKLSALLMAQREALRLHGLSERQVDQIAKERKLLRELQIVVPTPDRHSSEELRLTVRQASVEIPGAPRRQAVEEIPLVLSELNVHKGQAVTAGTTLCVLSDMRELYIEGAAYEEDADLLERAAAQEWPVTAIRRTNSKQSEIIPDLAVKYLDNHVSEETRSLKFYVGLPNSIVRSTKARSGQKFVGWKYRPGQRMQLRVPVEEWADRIVLPVDAIAKEGADYFVFVQNGDHFDRRPVHVEYRDQLSVVVANDGSIFPGDVVATTGAHQMQMALKNKSGGAVDPHAGHNH